MPTNPPVTDQQGRHAIITGANAGLGFQTALQLAQRGARITLACRSRERAETALQKLRAAVPGGDFDVALVNLGDLSSVQAFADDCTRRLSRLDYLCNNAGVIGVPRSLSPQGFELHMATNYFGPFALVGRLLGLLRDTPGARIVNISSQIHRISKLPLDDLNWERRKYSPYGAYGQSKLAVSSFTVELERRLRRGGIGITALMAHPGFCETDIPPTGWFMRLSSDVLRPLVMRSGLVHTAAEGARSSLYALTSADAQGADYIGPDNWIGSAGAPARSRPSALARDPALAAALWERSSEVTGVSYLS